VSGRDQGDESKRTIVEVVGAVKLFPCLSANSCVLKALKLLFFCDKISLDRSGRLSPLF
jgi:hypothetical protein